MSEPLSGALLAAPFTLRSRGRGFWRISDAALLKALSAIMRHANKGLLHITLPSGRSAVIGFGGGAEVGAELLSYGLIWKVLHRGLLGFAEAYISGEIETDDLRALLQFFLDNETALSASLQSLTRSAPRDFKFHIRRKNTRMGSRRNIAAHYDLGNEFYSLWLDASLSYSSGIYAYPSMSLEEAQAAKHARIVEALDLRSEHEVLEIGCGWGALAKEIASRVARITATTISERQLQVASDRLARSPHAERAEVRFEDYRDTLGSFDRIASIEMIEAVGEDNWPTYFGTIRDRLKPGGLAVVQAITIRDDLYEHYSRNPDFIQRYIFPGGMLPSFSTLRSQAKDAGLEFLELERFGSSYALTILEWHRRFDRAWPRIEALGFDERFRRMWTYYLTYCEIGFQYGMIDVGLYRLRRP